MNIGYKIYLRYLRFRIYKIKTIQDIIKITQNIGFFIRPATSDTISAVFIDCFNRYPLTEIEIQKLSLFQQHYDLGLGIENYASFLIWISCIQTIIESEELLRLC